MKTFAAAIIAIIVIALASEEALPSAFELSQMHAAVGVAWLLKWPLMLAAAALAIHGLMLRRKINHNHHVSIEAESHMTEEKNGTQPEVTGMRRD